MPPATKKTNPVSRLFLNVAPSVFGWRQVSVRLTGSSRTTQTVETSALPAVATCPRRQVPDVSIWHRRERAWDAQEARRRPRIQTGKAEGRKEGWRRAPPYHPNVCLNCHVPGVVREPPCTLTPPECGVVLQFSRGALPQRAAACCSRVLRFFLSCARQAEMGVC